ncbi:MAG: Zn-dependent hydrolase [Burkholderiaceae bacterium]
MAQTVTTPRPSASASASAAAAPRVNGERLWRSLMELARIGATAKGGVCRLALTELDRQGRELFMRWAREAGLAVRVDAIGNVFARRAGRHAGAGAVMAGSHLDTQPTGGKFDGCYGVLAALEAVRTLNDAGIVTDAPLEIAVWTNEEGSRFVPVMMGSGVFAGAFTLEHALAAADAQGVTVAQALQAIGFAGEHRDAAPPRAYFEAHIEQGPVLEAHGRVIGAVTAALGQRWYDVAVHGSEAHAGPTPMDRRHDALLAASELVVAVNRIALDHAPHARSTVGYADVYPNSRNVIAGRVRCSVDLRAPDAATLQAMDAALHAAARATAAARQVQIEAKPVVDFAPQPFAAPLVQAVRDAARALGHEPMDVVSGAGHDAVYLARVAPTAMIFVPCAGGISHNEIESAEPAHLEAGANVLLRAMLHLAGTGCPLPPA